MDKQLLHSENNFIKEHLKLNKMLLSTGEIDESIIKLYYVEERIGVGSISTVYKATQIDTESIIETISKNNYTNGVTNGTSKGISNGITNGITNTNNNTNNTNTTTNNNIINISNINQTKIIYPTNKVTIKKIQDPFKSLKDSKKVYREIIFLHQLNKHPNIVFLRDVIKTNRDIYLILEFVETNLSSICQTKILRDKHKQYIAYQLFKVLKYIHSADLIHRNLRPTNILITKDCEVKITDFGLTKIKDQKEEADYDLPGYLSLNYYKSPEVLIGGCTCIDSSSDMWSLGCILAEMFTGNIIFKSGSIRNQLELIIKVLGKPNREEIASLKTDLAAGYFQRELIFDEQIDLKSFLYNVPSDAFDLILQLIVFNPSKRLTAKEGLKHKYFKEFHNPDDEIDFNGKLSLNVIEDYHQDKYTTITKNSLTINNTRRTTTTYASKCSMNYT